MNEIFESCQELLRSSEPNYVRFCRQLKEKQTGLSGKELAQSSILMRLSLALEGFAEQLAGTSDISILLRQAIRAYEHRLAVKRSLWQVLSSREQVFGLRPTEEQEPDMIELVADPWQPRWLDDTQSIDKLEQRRYDTPVIADGLLYAMSSGQYTTYQSDAQKAAVQACLFAPPGSTLLVTLPTGGGKSVCMQLPAWQKSEGGRIKGGTTLVVVPTVSLALDQEERVQLYFANAPDKSYRPCSLTNATPDEVKATIRTGLYNGTLPILFVSPESLMNTTYYALCLEAAKRGCINWLVIDEAHLVETWGAGFRTEFQILSAYQKKLLEVSQGQLRTLLISATVTRTCAKLLQQLFSNGQAFQSVRADRLRPEITYWFHCTDDEKTRQTYVMEALRHLPRPAIVYVTTPDDTEKWLERLRGEGFERIAAFSGKTDVDERLRIIKEWNNNRRDIMVATSAFGVGVDKSDVRTVIHACLPENINRFYQEIGRAGRDGLSAISFICVAKSDVKKAQSMTLAARITVAKAIPRWEGMQKTKRPVLDRNDTFLLNTDEVPSENQEMYQGSSNREWNEHTLLLMQRAGLITITDTRDETARLTLNETDAATPRSNHVWLEVRILQPNITNYPRNPDFQQAFDHVRQQEVNNVRKDLYSMRKTVTSYAERSETQCLSHFFAEVYPQSALACGGCPACRQIQRKPYSQPLPLNIEKVPHSMPPFVENATLEALVGRRYRANVFLDEPCDIRVLRAISPLLKQLVLTDIQQLILPVELVYDKAWTETLITALAEKISHLHMIFTDTWLTGDEGLPLYAVPTLAVYPIQNDSADQFHRAFQRQMTPLFAHVPVIAIVRRSLMLKSESGRYAERINGLPYTVDSLMARLEISQNLIY